MDVQMNSSEIRQLVGGGKYPVVTSLLIKTKKKTIRGKNDKFQIKQSDGSNSKLFVKEGKIKKIKFFPREKRS